MLQPGDIYERQSNPKGIHRARTVRKSKGHVLVEYDYRVTDDVGSYGERTRWYRQAIPPVEKIAVQAVVLIGDPDQD